MRHKIFCPTFIVLLSVSAGGLYGQGGAGAGASRGVPNPTLMNRVYYCYRPDSLVSVEQAEGRMKNKKKAFGFGGNESVFSVDGARSPVRIKAGDSLRFTIKVSAMMDPSMMLKLYSFEPQKDSREAVISNQSRSGKDKGDKAEMGFDVQKVGDDVYIVIPPRLVPGEYGFMDMMMAKRSGFNMSYTFFSFGIDP